MPYHLTRESTHLRLVFFDDMTSQDLRSLGHAIGALEDAAAVSLNRLTDLSQISWAAATYADMLDFAERRKAQRLANPVKSAIVAPRPVQVGFARMFQMLMNHPQIEVQLFETLEEAEAWLTGV
jgi:hypothetical protein